MANLEELDKRCADLFKRLDALKKANTATVASYQALSRRASKRDERFQILRAERGKSL